VHPGFYLLGNERLYGALTGGAMHRGTTNMENLRTGRADLDEVLFEFSAVGNSVKVCAVDPVSMAEATIFGPVGAGEEALKQAALRKLEYVLAKKYPASGPRAGKLYA
jgi:hypothetical protein